MSSNQNLVADSGKEKKEGVWWVNGMFVIVAHVIGALALLLHSPKWETAALLFFMFRIPGYGYVSCISYMQPQSASFKTNVL
jgi:hypothetical protein